MSGLKNLYQELKARGLIRNIKPEYEDNEVKSPESSDENPAQSSEIINKNKQEFIGWKNSLSAKDKKDFETIFEQDSLGS